jgi:hypothetical protein
VSFQTQTAIQLPHELPSKRAFRSTLACWYPETNLVFVNLDQLIGLKGQGRVAGMMMLLHELVHAADGGRRSRPWGRFSGVVLNLSDLAFKSVEDILKGNSGDHSHTKTKILIREIAMDRLFLASRKVVEILAAYELKKTSLPLLASLRGSTGLRVEFEDFYERMFRLREAEFLKLYEKKIPSEILARVTKEAWSRDRPALIGSSILTVEGIINQFVQESLKDSALRALYKKLADIENLSGSRDLAIYLCRLALDVPFHHDAHKWVTGLPFQFNPERRLSVLLDAVKRLLGRAGSKRRRFLADWIRETKRNEPSLDVELDQVVGKESGVEFYNVFSLDHPKNIHFNCEMKQNPLGLLGNDGLRDRNDIRTFFRRGVKGGSQARTPAAALSFAQQWGFLPVAAYTLHRHFRISFSPKYDCRYWKIGWCLNYLKDQIISNPNPDAFVNPGNLGYFGVPEYLRRELVRATRFAKKVATARSPESLLHQLEITSSRVERVPPT